MSSQKPATKKQSQKSAFTLAEILITISIVGILSAILIPNLMYNNQKRIIKNRFKKTYNSAATALLYATEKFGAVPKCYYTTTGNAVREECSIFFRDYFFRQLNVSKYCEKNGYANGCLPNYTIENFPIISGCTGFSADNIKTKSQSAILKDGSIIFTYTSNFPLLGIDVNGFDGPNQPGTDVYGLQIWNEGYGLELGKLSKSATGKKRILINICFNQISGVKWMYTFLDEILN